MLGTYRGAINLIKNSEKNIVVIIPGMAIKEYRIRIFIKVSSAILLFFFPLNSENFGNKKSDKDKEIRLIPL